MATGFQFLSPVLKKSTSVDFASDFNKFIRNSYDEDPAKFKDAIREFNQLREASCVQTPDKHEASLDVLLRYFDQLTVVDTKLPISESQIRIKFTWQDSFNVGGFLSGAKKHTAVDLPFERCCLLFNIGALQCQIAKAQNFDSDEGLKAACKHFQGAAGTFTRLRDDVYQHLSIAPTPDLGAESTTAMCNLMLAQAQEAFFLKATKDKMQDKIIAKLAHQASDLYADTLSSFQQGSVKTQWEKDWTPVVSAKQSLFLALAEESQAKAALEGQSYGESISRLKKAVSCLEDAVKRSEGFYDIKGILARVKTKLEKELKDNKMIYSDPVPEYATIEPVGKAALAKPLPFNAPQSNFVDLFSQLMPFKVNEALQVYEQRKMGLVNSEIGRLRVDTQELTSLLTSYNLPAALEDTSGTGAPPSVLEKAGEVRSKGGITRLQEMIHNLPELLVRNKEILDETVRVLQDEDREDGECRAKYGDKWNRMPSAQLTVNVRADISKYQGILTSATGADKVVHSKFEANRESISILSQDQASVVASIPTSGAASRSGSSGQVVQHLKQLYEQSETLKAEREVIESSLKDNQPSPASKFLECLKSEGSVDEETISMTHLQDTYTPLQQQVQESLKKGTALAEQIRQTNAQFVNECQQGDGAAAREKVLKDLQSGYEAFNELIGNLEEGAKFYGDLTNLLLKCQQRVGDLTFARRTEKDDLCRDLDKVLAKKSGPGRPTAYVPPGATSAPPPQQFYPQQAPPPQQAPRVAAPPPQQAGPSSVVAPPANTPYYPGYPVYGAPPGPPAPGYPYGHPQQVVPQPGHPAPPGAQAMPYYPMYGAYGYPPYGYQQPPPQ